MTAFALAVAVLAAVALALALRPLWTRRGAGAGAGASARELSIAVHRDELRELEADLRAGTLAQVDYERARQELEKRLLEDVGADVPGRRPRPASPVSRWGAVSAAAALPLVALAIYVGTGDVRGLDPQARAPRDIGMAEIEAMVQRLADRLEQNPDDAEGWRMLGRSYSVMGRFAEAARAYSRAAAKNPRDAGLLADLADALAMARGQNMEGEPEELVLRALQIDPKNLKALALAGTAAFNRDDFKAAVRHWQDMLAQLPADSEDARMVQANIQEARSRAGGKPEPKKNAAAAALTGTVTLAPRLASQASPGDTVFIFARAADGPPMPLAALRRTVRDLPVRFSLDDSMAMGPAAKLSAYPKVIVVARISKGGTPGAQSGDLQGASKPVANSARDVAVVIDSVVP
ncbi:MAG TPA: c-type cytochrome biogenesis protein CcmI [Burkholderiales bacterium]|nr:c-type cytochrome biogenesis protein CcmI [Burkholderiales bacterium]